MKAARLREAIEDMAHRPGIAACVLVDMDAGMAWHSVGQIEDLDGIGSTCSDYWRLNRRVQGSFSALGDLRLVMLVHQRGQLIISECGKGMLLVAVMNELRAVDWEAWKVHHASIAERVNDL